MDISDRLKELRKLHNYTQKQVYEGIGVAPVVYQRYEYGTNPRLPQLIALADFFDVSLDYLVGRSDVPDRR